MIFNSFEFFIFLPIVYLLYLRGGLRFQNRVLLLASYIFYGWWDARFLYLIAFSTAVDYCAGLVMTRGTLKKNELTSSFVFLLLAAVICLGVGGYTERGGGEFAWQLMGYGVVVALALIGFMVFVAKFTSRFTDENRARLVLIVSLVSNLGLLGVFKYYDFFVSSAVAAIHSLGFTDVNLTTLNILLPVGISFYTFQTLSYSIDIYRKKIEPCHCFWDFALFVSYFPQLVAGPIERAAHLLPAIMQPRVVRWQQVESGIGLIAFGLFKKVVIADGLAGSVDSVYGNASLVSGVDVAIATLFFAIQIYCDFSGYTDIARGVSRMMGIELMKNFRFPYFSRSPSEFWQRWHISLSSWLRDYLYISLGGNRGSELKTYRNLSLTMLLGGLWHGAAWNYILWGAFHGGILCIYRMMPKVEWLSGAQASFSKRALFYVVTLAVFFVLTLYGWLLFRATSFEQIVHFTQCLFVLDGWAKWHLSVPPLSALLGLPILFFYDLRGYLREQNVVFPAFLASARPILHAAMVLIFIASLSTPPAQFIYFQF